MHVCAVSTVTSSVMGVFTASDVNHVSTISVAIGSIDQETGLLSM